MANRFEKGWPAALIQLENNVLRSGGGVESSTGIKGDIKWQKHFDHKWLAVVPQS